MCMSYTRSTRHCGIVMVAAFIGNGRRAAWALQDNARTKKTRRRSASATSYLVSARCAGTGGQEVTVRCTERKSSEKKGEKKTD